MNCWEALREKYRPDHIGLLLIAESPPSSEPPNPRFFYNVDTKTGDSLYLETMKAVFHGSLEEQPACPSDMVLRERKESYLSCFRRHGLWLQDAVPDPLPRGMKSRQKALEIQRHLDRMICIVKTYPPDACVLLGSLVYANLAGILGSNGVAVLNAGPIPLPFHSEERKATFRSELRRLLTGYAITPLKPC